MNQTIKNAIITYMLLTTVATICLIVAILRQQQANNDLHIDLITERIEHLRLKTCMAYLYMDDIVEKKDGEGVEIIWFKKP